MSKPNYRKQAMGLAALGRGPDNTLVHMSRGEVASLQKIANTAGGSLSINPKTGLPEAGVLNSFLPMIAGGIATILSGGTLAPILAGAATGALTGDKDQPWWANAALGGLSGFGAGTALKGLAGAGTLAGKEAASAATQEALKNTAGEVTKQIGADALKTNATQALSQGVQALGTEGGRQAFMGATGKLGLAAAGAPVIAGAITQPTLEAEKTAKPVYYTTDYNPYDQTFSGGKYTNTYPGTEYLMAEGGEVPPSDPMAQTRAYYQGLLTPQGKTPPSSQALIDYMNRINTNVVQTPVPARPTPPPAATSTTGGMTGGTTGGMTGGMTGGTTGGMTGGFAGNGLYTLPNGQVLDLRNIRMFSAGGTTNTARPTFSYDQESGKYTQTSGPMGGTQGSPLYYNKQVRKKIRQFELPTFNYDYLTGTYTQTSGPTGGVTNPYASTDFDRFLRKDSKFLRPLQHEIRRKLASQGVAGYAAGGPTYAAGGKLLRGPGDGMSDSIPAVIGGTQRAALADGEFVMPADVVAHLGNGSTTAGAGRLYEMMDRVRKARTGSTTQPPAVNMDRLMPA